MAKTIRIKVYSFNELSDDAKQKAIENYRAHGGDYDNYYASEITDSVQAMCDALDLKTGRTYADVYTSNYWDNAEGLSGARLAKWVLNNYGDVLFKPKYLKYVDGKARYSRCQIDNCCVLTGVCYDNVILQPIYDLMSSPEKHYSADMLMSDISHAISKAYEDAEDYVNSDEYISEGFIANEYLFTKDGRDFNY